MGGCSVFHTYQQCSIAVCFSHHSPYTHTLCIANVRILVPKIKEHTIITWTEWSNGNALYFAAGRCLVQILAETPASLPEVCFIILCSQIPGYYPNEATTMSFQTFFHSSFLSYLTIWHYIAQYQQKINSQQRAEEQSNNSFKQKY
jgi:hypothetical protein